MTKRQRFWNFIVLAIIGGFFGLQEFYMERWYLVFWRFFSVGRASRLLWRLWRQSYGFSVERMNFITS